MNAITINAPAKVNTILRIVGKRADGCHDLQMVLVPLTLADEVHVELGNSEIEFKLDGEGDAGMMGEKNLVVKAAMALKEAANIDKGAKIVLEKKTPIAAGLGGGSSDAAAVLKALNSLWKLNWDASRLVELGAKIGADVPFFCHGKPAFVTGIGDMVHPYEMFPKLPFLLINPGFAVPTPWVYKQWDFGLAPNEIEGLTTKGADARSRQSATHVVPLFQTLGDVVSSLHNDLEAVTIPAYPEIDRIKKWLSEKGSVGALMSGSGPTVFGVFENEGCRDQAFGLAMPANWRAFRAESVEKF